MDQIGNESSKTPNWILKSKPLKEHNRKCNFALFENVQKVLDLNSNFLKWPNIFHLLATFHNEVNAVSNENVQKIHNFQGFLFLKNLHPETRGERERLFGSQEREGKLKIPFPFYGKGTGIRKCYGKGREWEI